MNPITVKDQIEYIREKTNNNNFAEVYKQIILKKNASEKKLDEEQLFEELEEEQLFEKIYDEQSELYSKLYGGLTGEEKIIYKDYLQMPDGFNQFLRNWMPSIFNAWERFIVLPNHPQLIIILSFLSEFNADECNQLLIASRLPKLHGRNEDNCIYIYCLNNKINYKECLKILKKYKDKRVERPTGISVTNFYEMKLVANEIDASENYDIIYTDILTESIMELETEDEFNFYMDSNYMNFSEIRNTPVRYLCDWILEYLNYDDLINEQKKNLKFEKEIKKLWIEFNEFYLNYSKIALRELGTSKVYSHIVDKSSYKKNKNYILNVLYGKKTINQKETVQFIRRKFFVMLYVFLHTKYNKKHNTKYNTKHNTKQKWRIASIDEILDKCGFRPIGTDYPNIEDYFWEDMEKNQDNIQEFMESYVSNLYCAKIYQDILTIKQRAKNSKEEDLKAKYIKICNKLISYYETFALEDLSENLMEEMLKLEDSSEEDSSEGDTNHSLLNFITYLNYHLKMGNNGMITTEQEEAVIDIILDEIEHMEKGEYRSNRMEKYFEMIESCSEELHIIREKFEKAFAAKNPDKKVREIRVNYIQSDYIENPLYLNPRIDF